MGSAEKRGNYWRGRYKTGPGKHLTVVDENGKAIRFATKGEAQRAASEAENKYRRGDWRDPALGQETFGEYANRWYEAQDLAASTMQNYKRHIEEHLLPEFEDKALAGILRTDVDLWEKEEKAVYAASSVKTWRSTLHLIFEDAIDEGLITSNPAARRRGRGKRAGRSRDRGPEKVVTDPLGILLTAERAALLSGRDDEFVAVVLKGYTGMRWGEIVGLETEFARPGSVRVEWQLYELDTGKLVRCPPKGDSYRNIDAMDWLSALVANHVTRTKPTPCPCHGKTYVFRGQGAARTGGHQGAKLVDVARRAEVSTGTVSNVLNHPDRVTEAKRVRVEQAVADLGFVRGGAVSEHAAHWRKKRLRDVAVHSSGLGLVPEEGTTGGPPRTTPRRTVARRPGPRTRRQRAGRRLLAPNRQGPHTPRPPPYPPDDDGGPRHREGPHGPAHGPHRRIRLGALRPRDPWHAQAPHGRVDRAVGDGTRRPPRDEPHVTGARPRWTSAGAPGSASVAQVERTRQGRWPRPKRGRGFSLSCVGVGLRRPCRSLLLGKASSRSHGVCRAESCGFLHRTGGRALRRDASRW